MCKFHLFHGRMRSAVRIYDTVAKEITVARHINAEVATVCIIVFAVFILNKKSLVYPVPNPTTLEVRVFVDSFPLSPKVTGRVTHGMGIFRRSYRTVATFFSDFFQPSCTRILRYIHVGIPFPKSTFVVDRTVHCSFFLILYI